MVLNIRDGKVKLEKKRKRFIYFYLYLKSFSPLLLRHHPMCEKYEGHCFRIYKLELCMGCFLGYPTALMGIFIISFFHLYNYLLPAHFLFISIILIGSFILSPLKLTKYRQIKIIQKILIGFGASFLFWWIWILPNDFFTNLVLFTLIFGPLLTIFNVYHFYSIYKTCKSCEFCFNWNICPGFKEIKSRLSKNKMEDVLMPFNKLSAYFNNKKNEN